MLRLVYELISASLLHVRLSVVVKQMIKFIRSFHECWSHVIGHAANEWDGYEISHRYLEHSDTSAAAPASRRLIDQSFSSSNEFTEIGKA